MQNFIASTFVLVGLYTLLQAHKKNPNSFLIISKIAIKTAPIRCSQW